MHIAFLYILAIHAILIGVLSSHLFVLWPLPCVKNVFHYSVLLNGIATRHFCSFAEELWPFSEQKLNMCLPLCMWWIRYSGNTKKKLPFLENIACHDIHLDHLLAIHLEFT